MPKTGRRPITHKYVSPARHSEMPRKLADGLVRVDDLVANRRWLEARTLLRSLNAQYPGYPDVLDPLVNINYDLQDWLQFQVACEQLLAVRPGDADTAFNLAGAYLKNMLPALTLRQLKLFLSSFPGHRHTAEAQKMIGDLEPLVGDELSGFGVGGVEGAELAEQHEWVQTLLHQNRTRECREAAQRLLERWPSFTPALNNMSLAWYSDGDIDQALACAKRALEFEPENIHALGNHVLFACLLGDVEQARQAGARLRAIHVVHGEHWVKQAESFSMLGEDQAVVEVFAESRGAELLQPRDNAMLHHLVAVAELRLGREHHTRQYWQEALAIMPGLEVAQQNLEDLRKPSAERHAPWAFPFEHWLTSATMRAIRTEMQPDSSRPGTKSVGRAMRRIAQHNPQLARLAPLMLDRGDPAARDLAFNLAMTVKSPELLAALRDFGLGQRGPDSLRVQAVQAAMDAGLIPGVMMRFWSRGAWGETLFMAYEVTDEPQVAYPHSPQVRDLLSEAVDALTHNAPEEAERLFKQALEIEPGAPDVLNNLASACELQGRVSEARQLTEQNHGNHPDYFFASAGLAKWHAQAGEIAEARALLDPLLRRKQYHYSEFAALCSAEVELALARGQPGAARSWVQALKKSDPQNERINQLEQRIKASANRS